MPVLIVAAFVLSGATSLVLQVVWVRQLLDVFGSSSLAISTVLSTFMAGLGLGAWLGGRLADRLARGPRSRWRDPLLFYGLAEGLVGLCALAIPLLVGNYRGANAWLWSQLGDWPVALALARFALAGGVLLIPTTCMGATLPLLGRRVTTSGGDLGALGRRIGVLYAANTAGAVIGAGGAGFYWIPTLGVATTNSAAAAVALGLAGAITTAVLRRARWTETETETEPETETDAETETETEPETEPEPETETGAGPGAGAETDAGSGTDLGIGAVAWAETDLEPGAIEPRPLDLPVRHRRLAVAAFAISGAVAMALEVLWSRTMALVIGSSVYSFSLVLVVFLIGLATGAAAVARWAAQTRDPLRVLCWVFVGVAASILLTFTVADDLPRVFLALVEGGRLDVGSLLAVHTLIAGLFILPTALFLGAVMPLVVRAYASRLDSVGRDLGRAYAANTFGAIGGSFAGGFVVLPLVGLELGVRFAAAIDAALVIAIALLCSVRGRRPLVVAAAVTLAAAFALPAWNTSVLTSGLFRVHVARESLRAGAIPEHEVVFYEDGISTTVTVEHRGGRPVLKNNGKIEASTHHDMPTQILVGLLPALLHDGPTQDVFVVGYGSGITVSAIAEEPRVAAIDVVELEPAVYRAADAHFGPFNHDVADNPRVRRFVGDGRNVLLAGQRRYDVIVSEPSNPWIAGIASLFTREFFGFARDHLAEGGLYCQWAQLYELGPRNVKMIYRTFADSFPFVYAFTPAAHSGDTILIGAQEPIQLDYGALERRIARPAVRAELARAGIESVEDLLANLIIGPDDVGSFVAGAPLNTDDNALLEYSAPRDLLNATARRGTARLAATIYADTWPYGGLRTLVTGLGDGPTRDRRELAIARALLEHGRRREARRWVEAVVDRGGRGASDASLLLDLARTRSFSDPELVLTAGGAAPLPPPEASLFAEDGGRGAQVLASGYRLIAVGEWDQAWASLRELPEPVPGPRGDDVRLISAYAAYKAAAMGPALRRLRPLITDPAATQRRPAALYYAGRAAFGRGDFRDGVDWLERFARQAPDVARGFVATEPL